MSIPIYASRKDRFPLADIHDRSRHLPGLFRGDQLLYKRKGKVDGGSHAAAGGHIAVNDHGLLPLFAAVELRKPCRVGCRRLVLKEAEGGKQARLLALRDSGLQDDDSVSAFYDEIIGTYLYAENYMILLVHGTYDVPGRSSDHEEMFDASDYVYPFLICCICPVSLDKPGLCYDAASNSFVDKIQDWMIQNPAVGFLFPAFNDRNSDIHALLYYTKDSEDLHPEITDDLLGCTLPLPAGDQKETFNNIIEDTFSEACSFAVAKTVHENLNALLEGKKEEPQPTPLDKAEIRRFLSDCGADQEQLEHFENTFAEDPAEEPVLLASNIASTRKFEVKTDNIRISIDPARTDLIETRMIDGQEYILIPVTDNVEVNGIRIRTEQGRSMTD